MIEKLKKILKEEDTVLFIGSGVSLWSGLPTWRGLINELVDFLKVNGHDPALAEQELNRGDLLQAASYGFDKLTKPEFAEFIRKSCQLGITKPHDIHFKIISLGPNCYITTNYDKLLELSFYKWMPETYFRTVTNKQLIETAEIVGARAKNFLFKLHGDVEDSDSIILTREQYRALNFGGELYHALETTKTLMVSRPIVYIGFGLRDPDFLYLKDLLINTYKGGARDHYALMADVSDQEKDYWRRNFGIHIIDYKTLINGDGTKDHSPLLKLLDVLLATKIETHSSAFKLSPEFILSLNRYAAKNTNFENSKLHLPLVVYPIEKDTTGKNDFPVYRYYEEPVEKLLDNGPDKLILIGLPGGGKSYSLLGSIARFSKLLIKECIDDNIRINETVIPIYADLKLYQGNIADLIKQNLSVGLNLKLLCSNFKVKLYLDSFNEIPREYIESNKWNSDFTDFLQKHSLSIVISSRTIDGLENLEFSSFNLNSINKEFIQQSLVKNELELSGLFKSEVIELLQKPFFYKLVFENRFKIVQETSPHGIYSDLLKLISQRFFERFNIDLNISKPLSKFAMEAIDNGKEAFDIEILKKYIELELGKSNVTVVSNSQIINWLISQNFLIPIINERISFFHQSVTEYLTATRLANLYTYNQDILKEKLRYRHWDQVLFLTLSLLDKTKADSFLKTVIEIDFELALSSIRYMEEDTTEIVNCLLTEIESNLKDDFEKMNQISYILRNKIPISKSHILPLRNIIKKGNSLGGTAVGCLLDLLGHEFKNEALSFLVERCDDFNFCTEIGRSIKRYISNEDIPKLLTLSKQVQHKLESSAIKEYQGFESALSGMMGEFDPTVVYNTFYDPSVSNRKQKVQLDIICDFLRDVKNNAGLKISVKLLTKGVSDITFSIHMVLEFSKPEDNIDYTIFEAAHIRSLLTIAKRKRNENSDWAISSITNILSKRLDLISTVQAEIEKSNGVLKAALYYSISIKNEHNKVFEALEELLHFDSGSLNKEPFELLSRMDESDWIGKEILFVDLLKLRNKKLAYNLCDPISLSLNKKHHLLFDIGPINWWLEWFSEYFESKSKEWMFIDRVPCVISNNISNEKKMEFLNEFNNPKSKYRNVLISTIFRRTEGFTLNDFTEESIIYLLNDLKRTKLNYWENSILDNIATETFVNELLLPRLKTAKGIERENLNELIQRIGKKHKRRYLIE